MEFWQIILTIVASIMLVFRIWLPIFKLKDELQFRKLYISRIINLYFWIMLIINFNSKTLNIITVTSFPALIIASLWDFQFFRKFHRRTYWKKNKGWMLVERITLHPPMILCAIFMYIRGITVYVPTTGWIPYLIAAIIVLLPSFLFDERIRKKYDWPSGFNLLLVMFLSMIGVYGYIFFTYS